MNELIEATQPEVVGQHALFDYAQLDHDTQIAIRIKTSEIKSLAKRMAGDVVEIGGKLAEVKDHLGGNGRFNDWLSAELGWSERTAYNFIAVWQKFGAANFALENVATSALYLLAAPSTPAEAVESAKRIAEEGGEVTHAVAKAIVEEAKQARRANTRPELFAVEDEEREADQESAEAAPAEPAEASSAERPRDATDKTNTKEIEAAWRKHGVMVTIQLLPAKHTERQAMVTVRAGDLEPLSKVKPESEVIFVGALLELIEQYKRELPAKIANRKPAPKTPAKSSAKPAPKAAGKQAPKSAKQKPAKARK